ACPASSLPMFGGPALALRRFAPKTWDGPCRRYELLPLPCSSVVTPAPSVCSPAPVNVNLMDGGASPERPERGVKSCERGSRKYARVAFATGPRASCLARNGPIVFLCHEPNPIIQAFPSPFLPPGA